MPAPAIAAATATIVKKIPRGALIRMKKEVVEAEERPKISLPAFLFLLFIAAAADLMDLVELIPIIGTLIAFVFGMILGAILWSTYWGIGARSTSAVVAMIIGALLEFIPGISMLPLNVTVAVIVYALMNSKVVTRVTGAITGIGGRIKSAQKIVRTVEAVVKVEKALPLAA